jgi:ribonuclease P protein component
MALDEIKRLKKRRDFLRVAKTKQSIVKRAFVLQYTKSKVEPLDDKLLEARLGFTVSKRVGNAVERNRVRRRLKEASRIIFPKYGIPNYDYVLIGRKNALFMDFKTIEKTLKKSLKIIKYKEESKSDK